MIVPMKRLTLVGLKADQEQILSALQSISAVQLISAEETAASEGELSRLEARVQRLDNAQTLLKPYAKSAGLLTPKPEAAAAELTGGIEDSLEICSQVEALDREIAQTRAEADKRRAMAESLRPWFELTDGLETIRSTHNVRVTAGMLPVESLAQLDDVNAVVQVFGGEKEKAMLIACHESEWAELSPVLRAAGFQDASFAGFTGTAAENIARLEKEIAEIEAKQKELTQKLADMGAGREAICRALDGAVIERDREAGKLALGATDATFLLSGWARADQTEEILSKVAEITDACYVDFTDPEEGDAVPTVLKNNKLVQPFEAVTNLYSLPAYGSVDGTPLMAPFYFIFFGMMLSDSVYGIVLALGAWLFLKKAKPTGMMGGIAGVLMLGGISTIFMGLLFGTCAGVAWPVIFKGTALETVFPLVDASTEPIPMLVVCAGLGLVHMFYALFVAAGQCIRKGDWVGAIVDHIAWVCIITGLLLLAAPMLGLPAIVGTIGKIMAIAAALVVLLFAGRAKKNIGGRLISGAGKLYDIASWLSDVLSYARIFALGLSTGVIGLVLNTLCWDMLFASFKGNPVLMIVGFVIVTVLSVALHLFMMAISTLGCFVHTARLQYVEFFGKFYDAGGKAFRPLGYKTKHVRVK